MKFILKYLYRKSTVGTKQQEGVLNSHEVYYYIAVTNKSTAIFSNL